METNQTNQMTAPPSSLASLVHQVENAVLADPTAMDTGAAIELLNAAGFMKEKLKELATKCDEILKAFIQKNGDIEVGTCRWYVGTETHHKPRDHGTVLKTLLAHFDGDMDSLANTLASDAWKTGAVRKALGDDVFEALFDTIVRADVKTGKPVKKLKKADERYLK